VENSLITATGLSSDAQPLGRSVSIDQAAQLLGVSRRTIYYRIREGRLHTIRTIGGSQRVLVDSLQLASPGYSRDHRSSSLPDPHGNPQTDEFQRTS